MRCVSAKMTGNALYPISADLVYVSTNRDMLVSASNCVSLTFPLSITYTMSAMVTLVSATLVATTTFLRLVLAKTCFCSALERLACSGKISTLRTL